MKRFFIMFLIITLIVSMTAGCRETTPPDETPPNGNSGGTEGDVSQGNEGIAKIGLGSVTSIDGSESAGDGSDPEAQVDTVTAAVVFDRDDRVVKAIIDTAQTSVAFDNNGKLVTDKKGEFKTKVELGNDYNMKRVSGIGKEWFEQIAELEEWMVGKTVDEIKSMKVKESGPSHTHVPDEPELTSTVTITVEGYIAAVEKAHKNAVPIDTEIEILGLGHEISIEGSESADGDKGPIAQVDTTMAATAFDRNDRVVRTIIDTVQTNVEFDDRGKLTTDKNGEFKTKTELGNDYNMKRVSDINREWFEQIAELEKWMVGKTVDEIGAMKVKERDPSHTHVPDEPELTSTVTITVEGYTGAVAKSRENTK